MGSQELEWCLTSREVQLNIIVVGGVVIQAQARQILVKVATPGLMVDLGLL